MNIAACEDFTTVSRQVRSQRPRLIDLLRAELARLARVAGGAFRVGHRRLAERLGCSPGRLPALMLELEAAGDVERIELSKGLLIIWRGATDQSATGIDRSIVQLALPGFGGDLALPAAVQADQNEIDRSEGVIRNHDHVITPPPPRADARMGEGEKSNQDRTPAPEPQQTQQTQRTQHQVDHPQQLQPLAARLLDLGATVPQARRLATGRTLAELDSSLAELTRRYGESDAPIVLFGIWSRGQAVRVKRTSEEGHEGRVDTRGDGSRRRAPTAQNQRSRHPRRDLCQDGKPKRIDAGNPIGLADELPDWLRDPATPPRAPGRYAYS